MGNAGIPKFTPVEKAAHWNEMLKKEQHYSARDAIIN